MSRETEDFAFQLDGACKVNRFMISFSELWNHGNKWMKTLLQKGK